MRLLAPGSLGTAAGALLVALTLACAVSDLWKGKVYNFVTYPAIAVGLGLAVAHAGLPGLGSSLAGVAVCVVPALPPFWLGGLGGGDVKLLAAVGASAGWPVAAEALLLTFVFAGLIALGGLAWHGQLFATLGRALRRLAGVVIRKWRPEAQSTTALPPLRFAVAVCLGVLLTLWDLQTDALARLL